MFDKVGAFYELWEESSTRAHNMLTESGVDWGGDWLDLDQFMAVLSPAGRPAFGLASVIYDLMGYATGSGVLGASTEELAQVHEVSTNTVRRASLLVDRAQIESI